MDVLFILALAIIACAYVAVVVFAVRTPEIRGLFHRPRKVKPTAAAEPAKAGPPFSLWENPYVARLPTAARDELYAHVFPHNP